MLSMIISIIFIYLIYYFWISYNYDKNGKLKIHGKKKKNNKEELEEKKLPSEFEFFIHVYKIDLSKVNIRYFLQFLALVIAFDLSVTVTIMNFINGLWLRIIIGFILMIVIVLISFKLAGNYFKKKGLILNDKTNNKPKKTRK